MKPTFSIGGLSVSMQPITVNDPVGNDPAADSNPNLYWYPASGLTVANLRFYGLHLSLAIDCVSRESRPAVRPRAEHA